MKKVFIVIILISNLLVPYGKINYDWTLSARISTPYIYSDISWEEAIDRLVKNGVNVILDWAGFSDTYQGRIMGFNESFNEFQERARYIRENYPDVKYMVYIAPLELQTIDSDLNKDRRDDDGKWSTYTDHPDWLQIGRDGRKAVFYGSMPGMPFWVDETSEDVWLSPSNKEYKNIIINRLKEISPLVDAIWIDVPHLCFEFGEGWCEQWSSFDEESRKDFYNDTGMIMPSPPVELDWDNETWLKFVEWRYKQILDFIRDLKNSISGDCKLVVETSSHSVFITQNGCDISKLPCFCDVIAHEYYGPFYRVQYYSWLEMLANLKLWYDFDRNAGRNTSWLLSYVKKGDVELAKFHSAIVSSMGFNYYTSGEEHMCGMVDEKFMHDFFGWIENNYQYFYGWDSEADVAVLFSRNTLDYLDKGKWGGYAYHDEFIGTLMMLIESNIPFKVISFENISEYNLVILPDFACMNESQSDKIREYVVGGGKIIAINETSFYDEYGRRRSDFLLKDVFGVEINEALMGEIYENEYGKGKSVFSLTPFGRYYLWSAQPWENYGNREEAERIRKEFVKLIGKVDYKPYYEIDGAIGIPYKRGNERMIRIINFNGVGYGKASPEAKDLVVKIRKDLKNVKLLDFMGELKDVEFEKENGYRIISFRINEQANLIFSETNETLYISLKKPKAGKIYVMDREIFPIPSKSAFVIGKITVEAETNGKKVEFYVDNSLECTATIEPYSWTWNEFAIGKYEIKVVAYNSEIKEDKVDVFIINLFEKNL
ncbi:MAG: beta-galactosidase trimerization domain-containing protein [Thermoplasmatales archaeon]|nr:beta-galactosidase trimerization domain-containing protein [Thermoplasmatales archaeon]